MSEEVNVKTEPATFYQELGGAEGVRQLVDAFYDVMDSDPEFKPLRDLHPKNLTGSRDKLYLFLSGWLGGPSLYIEKYGHPRLRARHLPFPISELESQQWLSCMQRAMAELDLEKSLARQLMSAFAPTANHMRNR
jgi:hemoglobin